MDKKKMYFDTHPDPVATMGISNVAGIGVHGIEYEDDIVAYVTFHAGEKVTYHRVKVYEEERPYFKLDGFRYHLDEFIRI